MADLIRREDRGPVTVLTLNRPDALNALNSAVLEAIAARCDEIAGDAAVRAVVVTGEGRAFAAGADIAEMKERSPLEMVEFSRLGQRAFAALEALPMPSIAAVNGYALGGGCELALACDWIYASEKARFGQPEVNLGLVPGFAGTTRLPRRVGIAWAKEIILSGEPIKADVALRIGLANRVVAPEELVGAAVATGEAIASKGPVAVAEAKRLLAAGEGADARAADALEQAAFGAVAATEDSREGREAFLAKRDPKWKGR